MNATWINTTGPKIIRMGGHVIYDCTQQLQAMASEHINAQQLERVFDVLQISEHDKNKVMQQLKTKDDKMPEKFSSLEVGLAFTSLPVLSLLKSSVAKAAGQFNVDKAFDPLIDAIKDLAGPVCYIMFIIGFIYVIIGRPKEGMQRMKHASFGYIGIQWIPYFMQIIKGIGNSVA